MTGKIFTIMKVHKPYVLLAIEKKGRLEKKGR